MKDIFDDDDGEEEVSPILAPSDPSAAETSRKARLEREAKLRAMMEESDKEDLSKLQKPVEDEDETMEDTAESPDNETVTPALDSKPEAEAKEATPPPVVTGDGRRRGRRRITKKKTFQDEKGYFVTKEVEEWESFSESEGEKPASKAVPKVMKTDGAKRKSTGGPAGKGNIMSFFGKKQ
jgi:DNA polymerase delta subunit 3